ncbi:MAG: hypothetical protein ACI9QL_002499 [Candidatus Omnitrophota bacterium]|jgi:hypothetical protein
MKSGMVTAAPNPKCDSSTMRSVSDRARVTARPVGVDAVLQRMAILMKNHIAVF